MDGSTHGPGTANAVRRQQRWRGGIRLRGLVLAVIVALCMTGLAPLVGTTPARADTISLPGEPATVTAQQLPTWQINGVVWHQVMVGNTVYATGNFTTARPPGVAVGGAGQVAVGHLIAYDITTGQRVSSFSHTLNAQGLGLAVSPDRSRLYVVGDFTAVDGRARGHAAAFDLATGALVEDFTPALNNSVRAVAVSDEAVYLGGSFSSANGAARTRLAAYRPSGELLGWAPTADDNMVRALTVVGGRVVIGGQFSTINGQRNPGIGAVDPETGASHTWLANQKIRNSGSAGVTSLRTDGQLVYATNFAFGAGNFEGPAVMNPADGSIVWVADCLGDTYDTLPLSDIVYSLSHAHDCTSIGEFPDTVPRVRIYPAQAFTKAATGVNTGPNPYGRNFSGVPAPSLLHWFPELSNGSFTGQYQAAWTVTGNEDYVALGGEFPYVNGAAQQGLTRFARQGLSTQTRRPQYDSKPVWTPIPPSGVAISPSTIRVAFSTMWDKDNEDLRYTVYRDRGTAAEKVVGTVNARSNGWTLPTLSVTDRSVPKGAYTYQVKVEDLTGNVMWSAVSEPVQTIEVQDSYAARVVADGATNLWRFGETSPTSRIFWDYVSTLDGIRGTGTTRGQPGAIAGNDATLFDGTANGTAYAGQSPTGSPAAFSVETWFQTTSTTGGKIVGWGNAATGTSTKADRHLYVDKNGRLVFGVDSTRMNTVASQTTVNDGEWHHAVGTLDQNGLALYLDGRLVARDRDVTTADPVANGYWRFAGDRLTGWPNASTATNLAVTIDDTAIYPAALRAATVAAHYTASGRSVSTPPSVTDQYGKAIVAAEPELYWRLGERSGAPYAEDSSGSDLRGRFSGTPTFGVSGAVSGTTDTAITFTGNGGQVASVASVAPQDTYSVELWLKSTSTAGGQVFGFGDRQLTASTKVDRSLFLTPAGQLRFATGDNTGVQTTIPVNDGDWHHVVATQSRENGLALYVDGARVGTNPVITRPEFNGYWRIGGDTVPGNAAPAPLTGTVDEVSVYSRVLPSTEIQQHFTAGGGAADPNQPPTGEISATATGLDATYTARVTDPDGTIASYRWDFGDGSSGTGVTTTHRYAAAGTYQVTLTATDNQGASTTFTTRLTVTSATVPTTPFVRDAFSRTVSGGWGSADLGGYWTRYGVLTVFDVGSGWGNQAVPAGRVASAFLTRIAQTDADVQAEVTTDKLANRGGQNLQLALRGTWSTSYNARFAIGPDGSMTLALIRTAANTDTEIARSAVTGAFQPGTPYTVRAQAWGTTPTTLRAKVWPTGTSEPAAWTVTRTDSTVGLQAAGAVGLKSAVSYSATNGPVTFRFRNLVARPTGN